MISLQKISSAVTVIALLQLCAVQRTEAKGSEERWLRKVDGVLTVDPANVHNLQCRCKNPKELTNDNISQIKQDALNYGFLYKQKHHKDILKKMNEFIGNYYHIKTTVWDVMRHLVSDYGKKEPKLNEDIFNKMETVKDFKKAKRKYWKAYSNGAELDAKEQKKPKNTHKISNPCTIDNITKFYEAPEIDDKQLLDDTQRQEQMKRDYAEMEPSSDSSALDIDSEPSTRIEPSTTGTTETSDIDADDTLSENESVDSEASKTQSDLVSTVASDNRRRLAMERLVAAECAQF